MKMFSLLFLAVGLVAMAACSKSDKPETTVKPPSSPDAARLKSDAKRLQQATANAAKAREQTASPAPPTPIASPQP